MSPGRDDAVLHWNSYLLERLYCFAEYFSTIDSIHYDQYRSIGLIRAYRAFFLLILNCCAGSTAARQGRDTGDGVSFRSASRRRGAWKPGIGASGFIR